VSFHRRLRAAVGLAALLWALALAGCGPGVGGTGTGNGLSAGAVGLAEFNAMPSPVCASPLAAVLGCEAVVGSTVGALNSQRLFTGTCAVAAFEGDAVELDVLCDGLYFSGQWGVDSGGRAAYFGLVGEDPMLAVSEAASLEVVAQDGALAVTLRATNGAVLSGPLRVSPTGP
jgi:hypothetical protein